MSALPRRQSIAGCLATGRSGGDAPGPLTLSDADGESTADALLGSVDFIGTATIRASVGMVRGEEDIDIDAAAPAPAIGISPESLDFGQVMVDMDCAEQAPAPARYESR